MRRLLISLALLLLIATTAMASEPRERDVLLTTDGIVYTVDAVHDANVAEGHSPYYLTMTVQDGEERTTHKVPGSLIGGAHGHPALAYDADSGTLFLFWQETLYRGLASRLLFASLHDRVWSDVTELDNVGYNLRRNLRIAVTRSIEAAGENGQRSQVPQVVVHAVWWEETGYGEWARYAMLGIDNGVVTSTDFRYLVEFTGAAIDQSEALVSVTPNEVLRHPAVFANSARESVEVIFGDATTNSMHRLRIRPVLDGRVRIPIGVRGANMRTVDFAMTSEKRVAAMIDENSVALFTHDEKTLDYVVYRDGAWSKQRTVALSNELNAPTAIEALRRMVSVQ
ncbi:MAG: hypothetical protein ACXW2P_03330 [Thermoanaerobaculia bacterium]